LNRKTSGPEGVWAHTINRKSLGWARELKKELGERKIGFKGKKNLCRIGNWAERRGTQILLRTLGEMV